MKKHILITIFLALVSVMSHADVTTRKFGSHQVRMAQAMALADGVTTYYGLHPHDDNLVEANKLMPSSKSGIVTATIVKMGIITYYDHHGTPEQRDKMARVASGLFGGATINNVAAISGAKKSVAVTTGVLGGIGFYHLNKKLATNYNNKHQLFATRNGIGYQYHW